MCYWHNFVFHCFFCLKLYFCCVCFNDVSTNWCRIKFCVHAVLWRGKEKHKIFFCHLISLLYACFSISILPYQRLVNAFLTQNNSKAVVLKQPFPKCLGSGYDQWLCAKFVVFIPKYNLCFKSMRGFCSVLYIGYGYLKDRSFVLVFALLL